MAPCVPTGADSPALSADGTTVAFDSASADLVQADTNGARDVFVADAARPGTPVERVSVSDKGAETPSGTASGLPSVSGDGALVSFESRGDLVAAAAAAAPSASTSTIVSGVAPPSLLSGRSTFSSPAHAAAPGPAGSSDVFVRERQAIPVLSPTTMDFGAMEVNGPSPAAATFTLSNAALRPMTVTEARIQGVNAGDFSLLPPPTPGPPPCAAVTLGFQESCAVNVLFKATAAGVRQAELAISHNAGGSSVSVAALQGTGTLAAVTVQPAALEFGPVGTGVTATRTVTITQNGTVPHTIGGLEIAGPNAAEFTIADSTCDDGPLAPGSSCTVTVAFTPTAAGSRSATLRGTSTLIQPINVPLTGTGSPPTVVIVPSPVDFGVAGVGGAPVSRTATVTNQGPGVWWSPGWRCAAARPTSRWLPRTAPAGPWWPGRRAPWASPSLPLSWVPATGRWPWKPTPARPWWPSPASAMTPGWAFRPTRSTSASLELPAPPVEKTITVTNDNAGVLSLGTVSLRNAADGYALGAQDCSGRSLAPGESCVITVRFTPTAPGSFGGEVVIPNNVTGEAVALLTASVHEARVVLLPDRIDFGEVGLGTTASSGVVITNASTATLAFGPVTITGAHAGDFTVTANLCADGPLAPLAPGARCVIAVDFKPGALGPRTAILTTTFGVRAVPVVIELVGIGVAPVLVVEPEAVDFGPADVGTTVEKTLTLSNGGAGALVVGTVVLRSGTPDFTVGDDGCGGKTLQASETCEVVLRFTPSAPGSRNGELAVATNLGEPTPVALTGTGVEAALSIAPERLDFGPVVVGTDGVIKSVVIKSPSAGARGSPPGPHHRRAQRARLPHRHPGLHRRRPRRHLLHGGGPPHPLGGRAPATPPWPAPSARPAPPSAWSWWAKASPSSRRRRRSLLRPRPTHPPIPPPRGRHRAPLRPPRRRVQPPRRRRPARLRPALHRPVRHRRRARRRPRPPRRSPPPSP